MCTKIGLAGVRKVLQALLMGLVLGGCVSSNMIDETYEDGLITARTKRSVDSFNVLGKIDVSAHAFSGQWDGKGGVSLSTSQNVEGFDMTGQAVLVDMLVQVLGKALDVWMQIILTNPITWLEDVDDALPLFVPEP